MLSVFALWGSSGFRRYLLTTVWHCWHETATWLLEWAQSGAAAASSLLLLSPELQSPSDDSLPSQRMPVHKTRPNARPYELLTTRPQFLQPFQHGSREKPEYRKWQVKWQVVSLIVRDVISVLNSVSRRRLLLKGHGLISVSGNLGRSRGLGLVLIKLEVSVSEIKVWVSFYKLKFSVYRTAKNFSEGWKSMESCMPLSGWCLTVLGKSLVLEQSLLIQPNTVL